jgi:asparagine synthase (glutamine-hydrolysing)
VVDLAGGQQPMVSDDGQVVLVFNGEIYNYRQIRSELIGRDHQFKTESDTEVLLNSYLEWGRACLGRFNGMFSLVIYDARDGCLFAARDRFGEKPLYIYENDDFVYLASELKALVVGGVVRPTIARHALRSYLLHTYIIGPQSIYEDVARLQPGCALECKHGVSRQWSYWSPPVPTSEIVDEAEAIRETLALLRESVGLRLAADVPIGFFLSGGVDSSALVAVAAEQATNVLETFGVGFAERRYDERPYQRYVANRFGTRHHEIVLRPTSFDVLEDVAWQLDEPFADSAALPTWFLAEEARRHVTVALSGDGGDEIFAGYDVFRGYILSEKLAAVPRFVRLAVSQALASWPTRDLGVRARHDRLARVIRDIDLPARDRFVAKQQTAFREKTLLAASSAMRPVSCTLGSPDLFLAIHDSRIDVLDAMTLWQQTTSLPDAMLFKVDRMSMAHSLEVRAPFLDHRWAELANRFSTGVKLRGACPKYVLKKAMEHFYPRDFVWRQKQTFEVPLNYWFKEDLHQFATDRLLGPEANVPHLIRKTVIRKILHEHQTVRRDHSKTIWTLLMLEVWCRQYDIRLSDLSAAVSGA